MPDVRKPRPSSPSSTTKSRFARRSAACFDPPASVWRPTPPAPTSCAPSLQRPPHCVVLDLRMPHVNGFDVQRALSRRNAQVPVVIITGDDSPESRATHSATAPRPTCASRWTTRC